MSVAERLGLVAPDEQFTLNVWSIVIVLSMLGLLAWILLPIYWTFVTSLRSGSEVFTGRVFLEVTSMNVENYARVLFDRNYLRFVKNSIIVATGNTLLVLALAVPGAFAFRVGIVGSKDIFFWVLTNRMAPPAVFLLPLFFLTTFLNLGGTYLVLILTYALFNLPFAIWLLHGILQGIPEEIDEAVYVDGGTDVDVLLKVIFPLARPGVAVAGLLVWLFAWNHYVFTILLAQEQTQTITNGIAQFFTIVGTQWHLMAAATMVSMVPGIVLAAFVQRHIVTGLTFGAVKA